MQSQPLKTTGLALDRAVDWLKLARDTRFSVIQKHALIKEIASPNVIYQTSYKDLCAVLNLPPSQAKERKFQRQLSIGLEKDIAWLTDTNHHLICWQDNLYPALLREINDPPLCLFAKGNLALLEEPKISVVGSRRPTPVGSKLAQTISSDLARLGIVITSGMALGIDGCAHRAVLELNEPTIAVMGCGLDIVSPARHHSLYEKIAQQGLMLSEYPIAYPASRYTFPQRNRIVSGLSYGVVIVEAAEKSGTLITARLAMEQNREVFVVPGSPINPQYVGSHRLIQQGASLVSNAEDIVVELDSCLSSVLETMSNEKADFKLRETESATQYPLLKYINHEPTLVDQIILNSGLTASEVSSMLLILEVEGLVTTVSDGRYLKY